MPRRILSIVALMLLAASAAASAAPAAASQEDLYAPWARILNEYVDGEGLVDYAGLKQSGMADLEAFMASLASADPAGFASDEERIAFWINAYNAVVIWQVVERYPLDSVRDVGALWGLLGGFFKQKYPVAGTRMSADNIEHDTLRAKFDDERIHWALVCAAFGCPRLINEPYRAATLDATLAAQSFEFLRQPRGLQFEAASDTLYLSSYFDWYADDFRAVADTVLEYVTRYAPDEVAATIAERGGELTIRIMDYDWALNDQPKGPRAARPVPR
jgi:hypothetical protein